jgi:GH18 family chitinase
MSILTQYFFMQDEGERDWSIKFRHALPLEKLNRLNIAFVAIENGRLVAGGTDAKPSHQDRITELKDAIRDRNPPAKIFVVTGNGADAYAEAAQDALAFGRSVVSFLKDNDLDGYDIDWEEEMDANVLDKVLKGVRQAMNESKERRYYLTVATWPYAAHGDYNVANLAAEVDQINLMSYGPELKLDDLVADWNKKGFPSSKIIAGVGTECPPSGVNFSLDTLGDAGSIVQKVRYAKANGLAGMMEWRLDNDYYDPETLLSTYKGADQLRAAMNKD